MTVFHNFLADRSRPDNFNSFVVQKHRKVGLSIYFFLHMSWHEGLKENRTQHLLKLLHYVQCLPSGPRYVYLVYSPVWTCKHSSTGAFLWYRAVVCKLCRKLFTLITAVCVCKGCAWGRWRCWLVSFQWWHHCALIEMLPIRHSKWQNCCTAKTASEREREKERELQGTQKTVYDMNH